MSSRLDRSSTPSCAKLTVRTWRQTSLESLLLHGDDTELDVQTQSIVSTASPAASVRIARFLIHLLTGHPITTTVIFKRLAQVLALSKGTDLCDQVTAVVFGASVFKEYCVTEKGNEYRSCKLRTFEPRAWLTTSAPCYYRISRRRVVNRYCSCHSYHLPFSAPSQEA